MDKMKEAIDRIRILECPTGELEDRIMDILEDYKVANSDDIFIEREEELDRDGAFAYTIDIPGKQSFSILARAGIDDYVVSVVDVFVG